jgi:hypothetical protein
LGFGELVRVFRFRLAGRLSFLLSETLGCRF